MNGRKVRTKKLRIGADLEVVQWALTCYVGDTNMTSMSRCKHDVAMETQTCKKRIKQF